MYTLNVEQRQIDFRLKFHHQLFIANPMMHARFSFFLMYPFSHPVLLWGNCSTQAAVDPHFTGTSLHMVNDWVVFVFILHFISN